MKTIVTCHNQKIYILLYTILKQNFIKEFKKYTIARRRNKNYCHMSQSKDFEKRLKINK